jgi:hypothetical protein
METEYTNKKEVACNGGLLGHPKVYLNMEAASQVVCPYCSKKFIFQKEKVAK